jgi:hypothetical protein
MLRCGTALERLSRFKCAQERKSTARNRSYHASNDGDVTTVTSSHTIYNHPSMFVCS